MLGMSRRFSLFTLQKENKERLAATRLQDWISTPVDLASEQILPANVTLYVKVLDTGLEGPMVLTVGGKNVYLPNPTETDVMYPIGSYFQGTLIQANTEETYQTEIYAALPLGERVLIATANI